MYSKSIFGAITLCVVLILGGCATDTITGTASSGLDDTSLNKQVSQAVRGVPGVGNDDLKVSTHNGIVTLRGRTQTRTQAQDAIEAARHVPGVKTVDYDIHVDDQ